MSSMTRPLSCALLLIAQGAAHAGTCQEPGLNEVANEHVACRFFTGTRLFREGDHLGARLNWEYVLASDDRGDDVEKLRTDARNNLGYLLYMGLGTKPNRAKALQLWEAAARDGQDESSYHLCHAYGDAKQPEYQPQVALRYCREALARYDKLPIAERDRATEAIVRDIQKYIAGLSGA